MRKGGGEEAASGGRPLFGDVEWDVYAAVVEHLPDAAVLYDGSRIVHANPVARRRLTASGLLLGSSPAELAGLDLYSVAAPADLPALAEALRSASAGRPVPATRLGFLDPARGAVVLSCSFHPLVLADRSYVQVIARDVTARVHASIELEQSARQFRALVDHSPVGIALVEDGRLAVVNPAICRMLGQPPSALVGRTWDELVEEDDRPALRGVFAALDRGEVVQQQHRYLRGDGSVGWGDLTAVRISEGERPRELVHLRDTSRERAAAEQLRDLALRDALTGLGNRGLLEDRLSLALSRRPEQRRRLAVLFLDLDGFKRINDGLGHAVGDSVLRAVGRRIADAVRPSDTVARWGGDEFVVLLDGVGTEEEVLSVVRRVEAAVAAPIEHRDDELLITASVGIAHVPPDEQPSPTQLLQEADSAMYRAKQAGRNRHSVFDAALRAAARQRARVEALLRRAADEDRVVLHYQPLVELDTGRTIGAEALLRLRDDDGTLLYPDAFLDVAQDSDLMAPLEHTVLGKAMAQAAAWRADGHVLTMSVNVCAQQLTRIEAFETAVLASLAASGLPGDQVVFEVTEHALLDTSDKTLAGIRRLQSRGVQFSMDDFGTGYASMTYLQVLPVQEIKIDRRFVAKASSDSAAAAIVRAVAGIAKELGMRCVAEGIEDADTHRLALELGADHGQGYLYARPAPAEQFAQRAWP